MKKQPAWKSKRVHLTAENIWQEKYHDPKPVLLYFHIPFCEQKCYFCHFYSEAGRGYAAKARYLRFLFKEIERVGRWVDLKKLDIAAVAVGGGTPFEFSERQLSDLLSFIGKTFVLPLDENAVYWPTRKLIPALGMKEEIS